MLPFRHLSTTTAEVACAALRGCSRCAARRSSAAASNTVQEHLDLVCAAFLLASSHCCLIVLWSGVHAKGACFQMSNKAFFSVSWFSLRPVGPDDWLRLHTSSMSAVCLCPCPCPCLCLCPSDHRNGQSQPTCIKQKALELLCRFLLFSYLRRQNGSHLCERFFVNFSGLARCQPSWSKLVRGICLPGLRTHVLVNEHP